VKAAVSTTALSCSQLEKVITIEASGDAVGTTSLPAPPRKSGLEPHPRPAPERARGDRSTSPVAHRGGVTVRELAFGQDSVVHRVESRQLPPQKDLPHAVDRAHRLVDMSARRGCTASQILEQLDVVTVFIVVQLRDREESAEAVDGEPARARMATERSHLQSRLSLGPGLRSFEAHSIAISIIESKNRFIWATSMSDRSFGHYPISARKVTSVG